jgi:hypothetical protein
MMMNVEQSLEWESAGESEVLGENLPQCHFVHHKSHMTWPSSNPRRRGGKPATNRLSYDMALMVFLTLRIKSYVIEHEGPLLCLRHCHYKENNAHGSKLWFQ